MPADATWKGFASSRMKLVWLTNSRPDCLFEIAQLAQVTLEKFSGNKNDFIKHANRIIAYAREHLVSIRFPKLDLETLQVIWFLSRFVCVQRRFNIPTRRRLFSG